MGTTEIELRGGPAGHAVELTVGGQKMRGVHRVTIDADVKDVVRVTTYQYAEVLVSVEGEPVSVYTAKVNVYREEGWEVVAESTADLLWQAVADCARQLELAATGVAQSGTVTEPSGRPPGH